MLATTCVELTSRYAVELGYHATLVKDATAAYGNGRMYAAHELNAYQRPRDFRASRIALLTALR